MEATPTPTTWRGHHVNTDAVDYFVVDGIAHGDLFCPPAGSTGEWVTVPADSTPIGACPTCSTIALHPLGRPLTSVDENAPRERGDGTGEGTGSGSTGVRRATEKQVALITRLLAGLDPEVAAGLLSSDPAALPIAEASNLIDTLKTLAPAAPAAQRPNRFAGECHLCGGHVAAEAGVLGPKVDGRWTTAHRDGECTTTTAPAAPKAETPQGVHLDGDTVYKVQRSKTGNLYAKRLVESGEAGAEWEYEGRGPLARLSEDTLVTLETAKHFGRRTGVCCCCGKMLTNADSIEAGIGPVCASKF